MIKILGSLAQQVVWRERDGEEGGQDVESQYVMWIDKERNIEFTGGESVR